MAQNRSLEDTRKDAVDLLARGDFTAVIDLLSAGAADDPTGESEVLLGDAHFFSEAYGEAEACYRAALSRAGAPAGITAKLERAAAGAATGLARGEAQREVFARLFARDRLLGGPDLPDPQEAPPDLRRRRDGFDEVTHDLKIRLGHAAGTLGSFVFHHLTDLVGSRGTNDAVWTNWHASGSSLPGQAGKAVQILKLAYMRESLFANNLVRPYPDRAKTAFYETDAPPPEWARRWRTPDGSWNNLQRDADGRYDPMVGAAYTRFFRNVGDDRGLEAVRPRANPATDPVSVRELSRALFAPKGERTYVPFLNLWAAVWIQFMNHDWISHGTTEAGHTTQLPLAPGDPLRARYDIDHLDLRGTPADPTREPSDGERPPTFINEVTHWWDGSQLYGSDRETQDKLRSHEDGKLVVDGDGLLPVDPVTGTEATGFSRNWWVALGAIHTLFVREHNAICDTLKAAHPSWGDEALFQTARLVNAAVMAKIHTIEWTPGILPNHTLHDGMSANWYGLVTSLFGGQRKQVLEEIPITNRELGGIIGNPQATFAKYGLSEEFTAVYRMHSLLPDALRIVRQGQPEAVAEVPLADIRHAASPTLIREHGIENIALSLGVQLAGALVHNNFPRALLDMSVPGEPVVDLGAIDLFRDRERGVPPYNQLRAELGLRRVPSFDELTEDPAVAATLRELYGQDAHGRDRIDDMDLLVGTLCEGHRPPGFGFGETLFQVFILNASWRLLGDRFYTDDFREEVYTREGLDWIDRVTMKSVLLRHFPSLASTGLANVSNAFEPWDEGRLDPERHPLRAFDPALRADPWAGDAPRASEATAPATAAAAANANANAGVLRFWLYRNIVALFTLLGFRSQRVEPIRPPGSEVVAFRPYAAAHPDMPLPGLYEAESFPASDDAVARLRRIKLTRRLLGLARRVAPRTTPPVPADESRFLASVYPKLFRRAWAQPPRVPAELGGQTDVVAALAIRGPFGSYLRRANDTEVAEGEAAADHYVVDVSWMREYEPLAGLARPGGKAVLAVRDGRLQTTAVHAGDAGDVGTPALLAGLNEDLTTFRHNISVHLTLLTSFALATTNRLRPAHPLRRLLHHCFHTVLIGNRELAELQLSGPEGFSATVFSHGHRELARMATEHLARFDVWDLEPDTQFARRGTEQTPFAYPYRDNVLRLWAVTREYVDSYVRLYYPDDAAVRDDAELRGWIAELDRLVPNGVGVPDGGATVEWLVRLCATVIHVSTVEHDVLNNVVWDYSTLSWIVPTVVPSDGSRMDQRRAFDLIATLIGTWKPYNMLLTADIPSLALDEPARQVMAAWIARLGEIQAEMASEPREPSLSYPANLNVSISN